MTFKDGRYTLLQEFKNANSGNANWSFVKDRKDGKEYFIKEFLSPKYPISGTPGSKKVIERRKKRCLEFEKRQKLLKDTILKKTASGGNLVTTIDFFREGAKYYKISEKVDIANLSITDIASFNIEDKLLLMKTVAHSLKILHNLKILHADLKPDNILIKKTSKGVYTTKLIDFDDSFFIDNIPESISDIVGTMLYYSPEIAISIDENDTSQLTLKSDIYTLGVIYYQYITGELPNYDKAKYDYPWEASLDGVVLNIDDKGIPKELANLINSMLSIKTEERPNIGTVHNILKDIKYIKKDTATIFKKVDSSRTKKVRSGKLGGKLLNKNHKKSTISKLRGKLLGEKK